MTTFKEMEFTSLRDLIICIRAIADKVNNEYHTQNLVFHGLTRSNILIDPDDMTHIQLADNETCTPPGVRPRNAFTPWCATEVYLSCKTYDCDNHYTSMIGFASDYHSLGKLLFATLFFLQKVPLQIH